MEPRDLDAVQALYTACHPDWPARSALWWHAHPTLVLEQNGRVIGHTSFSVSIATDKDFQTRGAEVAYGHGVSLHPDYRGQGLGWTLAAGRHAALKALGIHFFMGFTQPENAPMRAIFKKQGLTYHAALPAIYPNGGGGLMYVGEVR